MTQEVKTALFSVSIKLDKLVLDKPTSINGQAKLKCKVIKKTHFNLEKWEMSLGKLSWRQPELFERFLPPFDTTTENGVRAFFQWTSCDIT